MPKKEKIDGKKLNFFTKESMKQYKDIFIDFDDTLYDTHGNAVIALEELFKEMNLKQYFSDPNIFYTEYWKANVELWTRYSHGEITRDYLILERFMRPLMTSERFRNHAEKEPQKAKELALKIGDIFLDYCSSKPRVVEGAHELMDYLKKKGYRIHMCSNGFHEVQYKKLDSCGLSPYFDSVILSEDAGVNKPAKEYFDYALNKTGALRETTIMIGDTFNTDILGAKHSGIDTIYFNRNMEYPLAEDVTHEVISLKEIIEIL